MSKLDLDAIKRRCEKATEGPWVGEGAGSSGGWPASYVCNSPAGDIICESEHDKDNVEFIAHARTDIPALVAEVEKLQDRAEKAERERDESIGREAAISLKLIAERGSHRLTKESLSHTRTNYFKDCLNRDSLIAAEREKVAALVWWATAREDIKWWLYILRPPNSSPKPGDEPWEMEHVLRAPGCEKVYTTLHTGTYEDCVLAAYKHYHEEHDDK